MTWIPPVRVAGAVVLATALVLVPTAALAVDWDNESGNQQFGDAENWNPDTLIVDGDDLVFGPAPANRAENTIDDLVVGSLAFTAPQFEVVGKTLSFDGGTDIAVTTGDVTVSPGLRFPADSRIEVVAGARLFLPSDTQVTGSLVFDGAGTVEYGPASALDGVGGAGEIIKAGSGVLILGGGLGGVAAPGVTVEQGTLHATGTLTGGAIAVEGGTLSGDGTIERIIGFFGTIAPGATVGGAGVGTLTSWNATTATDAVTLALDLQGTTNDAIAALEGVALDRARLALTLTDAPAVGTEWTIIDQERAGPYAATFTTSAGAPIVENEPFTEGGQRYSLRTVGTTTVLTYLGVAPVPPAPPAPAPAAPTLPATGSESPWLIGFGALAVAVLGAAMVGRRAMRRG
jgi:LPXTG-motif cell wall-anchored protein